jgi:DNA repair exonuclease SbcCD ATPase subunit
VTILDTLTDRLRRTRRSLDRQAGEARAVATAGLRVQAEIADLRRQLELHEQIAAVLTSIGEQRQNAVQHQIETIVTQGLRTIFGDDLSFHLVTGVERKTPVVNFVVRSTLDGSVVDTDVMDARGGGLAAIVGFLLRVVVLLLSRDRQATILIMDETFAHVSAEYEPRLAEFLRELADKTGIQIVLVTHSDAFSDLADCRYRFELVNGVTVVKPV